MSRHEATGGPGSPGDPRLLVAGQEGTGQQQRHLNAPVLPPCEALELGGQVDVVSAEVNGDSLGKPAGAPHSSGGGVLEK